MSQILKAIKTKNWHAANEEFATIMSQKLADALAAERRSLAESLVREDKEYAKCSNCGNEKHEKTFQRDRCGKCNKANIWVDANGKEINEAAPTTGYTKKALIRDPNVPVGQSAPMHLNCICGNKVYIKLSLQGKENSCDSCGRVWDSRGWLLSEGVGDNRAGWVTIKAIPSHSGKSRWFGELENNGDPVGFVVNPTNIPSPYSYSPTRTVYKWNGRNVINMETKHKYYEVIAVPSSEPIYKTDDEATNAFIAKRGR